MLRAPRSSSSNRTLASARVIVFLTLLGHAAGASADALSLTVEGVTDDLKRDLEQHLANALGENLDKLEPGRIRAIHRRAPRALAEALQSQGYYEARIAPSLVNQGGRWEARYRVAPGPPVTVTFLELRFIGDAATDAAFKDAKASFPLAAGGRLVHARWEEGKRALDRLLADRGYFDASIARAEVRVDRHRHAARAWLTFDSGQRYHFGEVLWPQTALAPGFLSRYVLLPAGTPFLASEMLALQGRLNDSNYFGNVNVEPRRDLAEDGRVPIEVELELRPAQRYSVGAGFGTDTGPRGRAAWLRPWVNAQGHRAEVETRISAVESSLSGLYSMPSAIRWSDSIDLTTQLVNEDTDSRKSLRLTFGVAHLTTRFDWRESLGLNYEVESFDVADSSEIAGLLVPSARWTRTWADDPVFPRNGLRVSLGLRGAHSALLSSTSFAQAHLAAKYVRGLGNTRFIARTELGALAAADFDKLPASERFFAGGDNSLRGFDYQALGPRNARNKVEGGRYLLLGSLEVEQNITGRWSAAVFSDFGNSVNSLDDPVALGVGFGLRWRSPIGPVRIDLANGVSDPDFPWRVHFIVGPDL